MQNNILARYYRRGHPPSTAKGILPARGSQGRDAHVDELSKTWLEVLPSETVRVLAMRLLAVHPLRAADSLQLAAALAWSGNSLRARSLACLDRKLRKAAWREGFAVLPAEMPGDE